MESLKSDSSDNSDVTLSPFKFKIILGVFSIIGLILLSIAINHLGSDIGECHVGPKTEYFSYGITITESDTVTQGGLVKQGRSLQEVCHKYNFIDRIAHYLTLALALGLFALVIDWYRNNKPMKRDMVMVYSILIIFFLYSIFSKTITIGLFICFLVLILLVPILKGIGIRYT